jgi:hypothetical protein
MSPLTESTRLTCKNYGTPAAIAGVAPTLDYRFALDRTELDAVTLTDKLTFTRAATCAFTNLGGNLQLAGANVPRFDHSPTTRQSLGLLVEESRSNLMVRSEEFDNAAWNKNNVTLSANATTAPDNTTTADKLSASVNNSFSLIGQVVTVSGAGFFTGSIFAKAGEFSWLLLKQDGGSAPGSTYSSAWFNLSTGTIGTVDAGLSASIQTLANGWNKCSISYQLTGSGTTSLAPHVASSNGTNIVSGADGAKGIFVWGAQLESGTFPTSYIQTTTATVARTESATVSLTGLPATRTLVEKPVGCATVAGDTLTLNTGYTAERVMVFPAALSGAQVTAIRSAM